MTFSNSGLLAREDGLTIKTPLELYNWAIKQSDENITKLNFSFASNEEYVNMSDKLENIFNNAKTLAGTQKCHCFVPICDNKIAEKRYSKSEEEQKLFNLFTKIKNNVI